jgi:hypothetical protein
VTEPHWLWRLDRAAWADAAAVEWRAATENVARRRTAIAHCRRAAGMALNGVLVAWAQREPERRDELTARWGRSYVEHLQRVGAGDHGPLPPTAIVLAQAVLATPMTAPPLVALGARAHADVQALVDATRALLDTCAAIGADGAAV